LVFTNNEAEVIVLFVVTTTGTSCAFAGAFTGSVPMGLASNGLVLVVGEWVISPARAMNDPSSVIPARAA
jgi:hypothetical protein